MSGDYKVFDGSAWKSICDCALKVQKNGNWEEVNPKNCNVKSWTGTEWCRIVCPCECPPDYVYNIDAYQCELKKYIPAEPSTTVGTYALKKSASFSSSNHGASGVILYEDISIKPKPLNGLMLNSGGSSGSSSNYRVYDNSSSLISQTLYSNANALGGTSVSENRVFQAGIWADSFPDQDWLSFEYCVNITQQKQYMIGLAADNQVMLEVKLDGQASYSVYAVLWSGTTATGCADLAGQTFKFLHVFPITLPVGNHKIRVSGMNCSLDAGFAAEIYDRTYSQMQTLMAANTSTPNSQPINPYIVFTTKSFIVPDPGPYFYATALGSTITWSCLQGTLNTCNGIPSCYIEDTVGCGEDPNELVFNFLADYIILEYKFLKPGSGQPADYWPNGSGGNIYDTPYTIGGITKPISQDVQGSDLDTHARLFAGPDQNTLTVNTKYKGFASSFNPYPSLNRAGTTSINAALINTTSDPSLKIIPLTEECIFRHSGDNTGVGFESVLINVKEFKARFGQGGSNIGSNASTQIANALTSFGVEMRAWWYVQPTRYPVAIRARMYKNTSQNPITGVSLQNFVFNVTGGEELIKTTPPAIIWNDNLNDTTTVYYNTGSNPTPSRWEAGTPKPDKRVNVFNYNAYTGAASFVNNNTALQVNDNKIPTGI